MYLCANASYVIKITNYFADNPIWIVLAEKIRSEVYANQEKSLCDLQKLIKHSFLFNFPNELLIIFTTSDKGLFI